MTVPVMVLMLAAMVTAMTASLRDHAAHAAAEDLAGLRAEHAAAAFVTGCFTHEGCEPPEAEHVQACAAANTGVVITAQVSWSPVLWKSLTPVTASRAIAYDEGFSGQLNARVAATLDPC